MTDESNDSRRGFGMVDPEVLRDPSLGWSTKLVYALLATYCAKERTAFPSRARMARELGISVRSVARALTEGKERGLFEVLHRLNPSGAQTSNLYTLRDLGGGFTPAIPEGEGAPQAWGDDSQAGRGDCGAHKQDHSSTPQNHTSSSSTSSDEGASIGPRTSSATRMKIHVPRNFDSLADGDLTWRLVKASVGAVRDIGIELTEEAKSEFGRALKSNLEDGVDRRRLVAMMENSLNDGAKGIGGWAWMFGYQRAS